MAKEPGKVKFSQDYEVARPLAETVLPVPLTQLRKWMERIEKCHDSSQFFVGLGWASLGIAASAFLAAITYPSSLEFVRHSSDGAEVVNLRAVITEVACWGIFFAFLLVGAVSLFFSKEHGQHRAEIQKMIVEDMKTFEDRHLTVPPT